MAQKKLTGADLRKPVKTETRLVEDQKNNLRDAQDDLLDTMQNIVDSRDALEGDVKRRVITQLEIAIHQMNDAYRQIQEACNGLND